MPLSPGTRLGPYEITAQIGVGGMGEVYRAMDTKLKRQIAIKILPAPLSASPDRLARFQREAEVLASLNHPNIAAIHGLEESEGITALVMELVEGEDLSQRIGRGAVPIDEALPMAKQIAEALEAAHEQGIVHRDLKPANVKVRADGAVKVLDFGLAKAMDTGLWTGDAGLGDRGLVHASQAPTITTPAMTQAGMILGTAAYMSPEQAQGRPVDRRADIWAFGVVLYEVLTGARLFDGATVSDTLAAVLKTEPDWTRLPDETPALIRRLLRRCLEKDRRRRLDSAAAARLEIEETLAGPAAYAVTTGAITSPPVSSPRGARVPWMVAAAAALGLAALAVPAARHFGEVLPAETRFDIATPYTNDAESFAVAPNGASIVFAASGDGPTRLWWRQFSSDRAEPLPGTEGARRPFWSPDGRSIGFVASGALKRIDLGSRQPRVLTMPASSAGAWSTTGVILFRAGQNSGSPLFRVPSEGGAAVAATTLGEQLRHSPGTFLLDGQHFLFYSDGTPGARGVHLGSLGSTKALRLVDAPLEARPSFVPPGWVLWIADGQLVAQRLDIAGGALVGERVTVADSAERVSASPSGVIAYRSGAVSRRQLRWFDRGGLEAGALGPVEDAMVLRGGPRIAPDGRAVAVWRHADTNDDLWLLGGDRILRFTTDSAIERNPVWAPDGRRIAFNSNRTGAQDLFLKRVGDGVAAEMLVLQSGQSKTPSDWSNDGRFLLFHSADPETDQDLWVLPLDGDRTPRLLLKTKFNERHAHFSPDGRWIVYMSNESGRSEVYVRPFVLPEPGARSTTRTSGASTASATGAQWQVSTEGGIFPQWSRDGREIYFIDPDSRMMAVPVRAVGSSVELGQPVALFQTHVARGGEDAGQGPMFDVGADGRFVIVTDVDQSARPITVIQNWRPNTTQ